MSLFSNGAIVVTPKAELLCAFWAPDGVVGGGDSDRMLPAGQATTPVSAGRLQLDLPPTPVHVTTCCEGLVEPSGFLAMPILNWEI